MQRLTKAITADSAELEKLVDKRQNQMLLRDGGQKQLKLSKSHNQEKQVEENILRLRVDQAEKAIDREGDEVYSLEKQKLELDAVSYGKRDEKIALYGHFQYACTHVIRSLKACDMCRTLNCFFTK